jgi:hypothetical protein
MKTHQSNTKKQIFPSSQRVDGSRFSVSRGMLLVIPFFMLFACFSSIIHAQLVTHTSNCFSVTLSSGGSCSGSCGGNPCDACITVTVCNTCSSLMLGSLKIHSNSGECFSVCSSSGDFSPTTSNCTSSDKDVQWAKDAIMNYSECGTFQICHPAGTSWYFDITVDGYDGGQCGGCDKATILF